MAKQKFSPKAAHVAGLWIEDALANVDCSIEHEAKANGFIVTDNKILVPFSYSNSSIKVRGVIRFDDPDDFALTIGNYAVEYGADDLRSQMIEVAASKEVKDALKED